MKYLNNNLKGVELKACCNKFQRLIDNSKVYIEVGGEIALCAGKSGSYFINFCPYCGYDFMNVSNYTQKGRFVDCPGCLECATGFRGYSCGDSNSGESNSGDSNSGHYNSGDSNSGYWNSGHNNSGNWNSGNYNSGDSNSGNWNSGNYNSGNSNSGHNNSGNWNSGNSNSGDSNSGNWNSGYFNSGEPNVRVFNKTTKYKFDDPIFSKTKEIIRNNFYNNFNMWVSFKNMTETEKEKYPSSKITGGFLRNSTYTEAWALLWENISDDDKKEFYKLPNFNWEIFTKITGIEE